MLRVRAGDLAAFELLVLRYQAEAWRVACLRSAPGPEGVMGCSHGCSAFSRPRRGHGL